MRPSWPAWRRGSRRPRRPGRRSSADESALAGPPEPGEEELHVLREYALLAGERGVLLGPRGDFSSMCFPR